VIDLSFEQGDLVLEWRRTPKIYHDYIRRRLSITSVGYARLVYENGQASVKDLDYGSDLSNYLSSPEGSDLDADLELETAKSLRNENLEVIAINASNSAITVVFKGERGEEDTTDVMFANGG
jgi:hypothetical protein